VETCVGPRTILNVLRLAVDELLAAGMRQTDIGIKLKSLALLYEAAA